MKSLSDLYKKEEQAAAPAPSAPAPEPVAEDKSAPSLQTPPGLPQEYVETILKNQPLPEAQDPMILAQEQAPKPPSFSALPGGETLCNATDIPYTPGYEGRLVTERIAQGPRAFVSRAQKAKFERENLDEKKETKEAPPRAPTLAHPDTLRPGTFIKGESPVYRPGA